MGTQFPSRVKGNVQPILGAPTMPLVKRVLGEGGLGGEAAEVGARPRELAEPRQQRRGAGTAAAPRWR